MTASVTQEQAEEFRSVVAGKLGLQFEDAKLGFLADILRRRLEAVSQQAATYLGGLASRPDGVELGALAQELTVPETYFFRNHDQLRAFGELCLPDRVRARGEHRTLRILSAGCASGEEAYSLAIVAREMLDDPSWQVSIAGVDVNPTVLAKAARARYSSWALRETPSDVLRRWFRMEGREAVLDDTIRTAVRFEQKNLIDDESGLFAPETYDVVFCRNVLMYLTPEHARAVTQRIAQALVPGGYLFLGHAETMRGLSSDFHLRHTHQTFYYQRKLHAEQRPDAPANGGHVAWAPLALAAPIIAAVEDDAWVEVIRRASARVQALTEPSQSDATPGPGSPDRGRRLDLGTALELLQKERFSEALEAVKAFPPDALRDPDALLLHAVLLTHSGKLDEAERLSSTLLELDELSAGAHYILALCREGLGDPKGAREQDQVAVYLDPDFAMPRLHLGLLARKVADLEAARRELGQALVLLEKEDPSRLLLFGGGFGRDALVAVCRAELIACGGSA